MNKELQEIINGQTHDGNYSFFSCLSYCAPYSFLLQGTNESLLQTKLALTVLEHLHLMLSIIDHNERSKSTTVTVTATTGTVKSLSQEKAKTITSERLGFAMENLLENTPTFERTHNHYFLQDTWQETSCAPVTIATQRTDIDSCLTNNHLELPSSTDHSSSSSSWHQHSSYYNNNPYYSLETSDWLPTLSQLPPLLHHHHHYNSTQTPLGSEGGGGGGRDEMESFDRVQGRPPMWRPYNDSQHHSHNTISLPLSPPPHSTANNTYNSHQQQPSTSFLVGELLDV